MFRRAHVLLHTKVNDPCPTVVIEAMACGVPVAYPASGGTVELVGDEGGIGVPHDDGFDRDEPPSPEALAAALTAVLADRERFAAAARAPGRRALRTRRLARPPRGDLRRARASGRVAGVASQPPAKRGRVERRA